MNDGAEQTSPTITTGAGGSTETWVFECATTLATSDIGFKGISDAGGNNIEMKDFTLYEITPGNTGSNALAMDGWYKDDNTLDIYRQHNDATYTKDGSFYSLKAVKGADTPEDITWPARALDTTTEWISRFAGRTVTFGAWVYSVDATDNVSLRIYDGSTTWSTSTLATANTWTWMEVTGTPASAATLFRLYVRFDGDTSDVAYISQPMLVFGSSIGSGNYAPRAGEIIWFENPDWDFTDYSNATISTADDATINTEAQTNGRIGKGVAAIYATIHGKDSAVASGVGASISTAVGDRTAIALWLQVNNIAVRNNGWVGADSNGDIYFASDASGGSTLSALFVSPLAIQTR